jgi:hypothetical protein
MPGRAHKVSLWATWLAARLGGVDTATTARSAGRPFFDHVVTCRGLRLCCKPDAALRSGDGPAQARKLRCCAIWVIIA